MRGISLLLIGVGLVACTTTAAQQQPLRSAAKQQEYDRLLAGKAAGPPLSCLPHYRSNDMVVIDESTIAFRDGSRRVYVNHMMGPCSNLASGGNALVTKTTTTQLCRGDIAQIFDTSIKMTVGSCSFGDFVPYSAPGYRG